MAVRANDNARGHDAVDAISRRLGRAVRRGASDLHLEPTADGYKVRYRIDGLLQSAERLDAALGRAMVSRLMVLAELLTYRLDVPQEGRMRYDPGEGSTALDLRVAIMPTTHGLRAAVRLPAELTQPRTLDELALSAAVTGALRHFARRDAGLLALTGPAGSGKTTTIYALLEHIAAVQPGLSIVSLEDPVERDLPGVTQIEVQPFGQLTYERALRSILRQDPQVLMLGEIRDAATALLAFQAALSGHRLITTLHAGDPPSAVARLLEMGLEPYQLTSALFGVVGQRLLRRRTADGDLRGRFAVAEFAGIDETWRHAIARRADAEELRIDLHERPGYVTMLRSARQALHDGLTVESELVRVFGDVGA